jgi:transposase-like protein
MKKNQIQFQPGMSLMGFLDRYGSEQQCREALLKVRWPGGFRCQGCGHRSHCHLKGRDVYQCNRCKRQVSLTSGTLFAETKLPLRTWFLAIYLLTQHKNGISALALRRQLGVLQSVADSLAIRRGVYAARPLDAGDMFNTSTFSEQIPSAGILRTA